jgi:hypothetical protein
LVRPFCFAVCRMNETLMTSCDRCDLPHRCHYDLGCYIIFQFRPLLHLVDACVLDAFQAAMDSFCHSFRWNSTR